MTTEISVMYGSEKVNSYWDNNWNMDEREEDNLGHYCFLCFRWTRALDYGRALQKKTFFSAQHGHWIAAAFRKKIRR